MRFAASPWSRNLRAAEIIPISEGGNTLSFLNTCCSLLVLNTSQEMWGEDKLFRCQYKGTPKLSSWITLYISTNTRCVPWGAKRNCVIFLCKNVVLQTFSSTTLNWRTGGFFSPKPKNKICSIANISSVKSTVAVTLPITSLAAHTSHLLEWT